MKQQHYREELVRPSPEAASLISTEVEKFAKDKGLQWEAWHHDEPIWYVWQDEPHNKTTVTKTVQVAAFAVGETPLALKAIAFAQMVNEEAGVAQVLEAPKAVKEVALRELVPGKYMVYSLLQEAWSAAQKITAADFLTDKVKVPPRPVKWPP